MGNSIRWIGNSFPRIKQFVLSDCNSQSLRTDCLIRWNEDELLNSGERIANRENELSYSRERINNPLERILNPMERITQFDITI